MELQIFLVPAAAALAPILASIFNRAIAIPLVVFEILLGILIGPSGFGWVADAEILEVFSHLGVATLFFMAGSEIRLSALKGRPGRRSLGGWAVSVVLAAVAGIIIGDQIATMAIIAIALSGTALGTISPILRDAGLNKGPIGTAISGAGAVGEFGPLVAVTLFLSGRQPALAAGMLTAFVAVVAITFFNLSRTRHPWFFNLIQNTLHSSAQFAVRVVMFVLLALIALALALSVDYLLASFTAGLLAQTILDGVPRAEREIIGMKLDGLAYGFFVPIFFVTTGVSFPLSSLLSNSTALILLLVFVVSMLIVLWLSSFFALPSGASFSDRRTVALFAATTLPLGIAVTSIGVDEGVLDESIAASMVGAGLVTVLLFPLLALVGRKTTATEPTDEVAAEGSLPPATAE